MTTTPDQYNLDLTYLVQGYNEYLNETLQLNLSVNDINQYRKWILKKHQEFQLKQTTNEQPF